jgi:hypothetical protein
MYVLASFDRSHITSIYIHMYIHTKVAAKKTNYAATRKIEKFNTKTKFKMQTNMLPKGSYFRSIE